MATPGGETFVLTCMSVVQSNGIEIGVIDSNGTVAGRTSQLMEIGDTITLKSGSWFKLLDGEAELRFPDGTTHFFSGPAEFRLYDKDHPAPPDRRHGAFDWKLIVGTLWYLYFDKPLGISERQWKRENEESPNAVVGVRG